MTKEITMEEVKELVEFGYDPLTESWHVISIKSNSTVEVVGGCWSNEMENN